MIALATRQGYLYRIIAPAIWQAEPSSPGVTLQGRLWQDRGCFWCPPLL